MGMDKEEVMEMEHNFDAPEDDGVEVKLPEPKEEAEKPQAKAPVEGETDDDDLEHYSSKVNKRIKKLTRGYADAQRERDEAVRVAQVMHEEITKLRAQAQQGLKVAADGQSEAARAALEVAKKAYKDAYEAGDSDALLAAAEAMSDAKIRLKEIEMSSASLQRKETEVQPTNTQQQPRVPQPDRRAVEWAQQNQWFLKDEEMTQYALGLDAKLKRQGIDPESDEYYEAIDARMRKVFPEYFASDEDDGDEPPKQTQRKPSNVVAPATRSSQPKKITLSKSQVALANKLGISLEEYARELVKREMEKE